MQATRAYSLVFFFFSSETKFFQVELPQRLQAGGSIDLDIEEVYSHALSPFPTKIAQSDKQYVLFAGNHYFYTPYKVITQTTTVKLASSSVESFSKLKPSSISDSTVTYGPYNDVEPFKSHPMRLHFENNSPFLAVSLFIFTSFGLRRRGGKTYNVSL